MQYISRVYFKTYVSGLSVAVYSGMSLQSDVSIIRARLSAAALMQINSLASIFLRERARRLARVAHQ